MKAVFDEEIHYYKYVYNEWTQPTLTGNNSFANGFAVNSNYSAFYPNTGTAYVYGDEVQAWIVITMQTQEPFIAKSFTFYIDTGWGAASGAYSISFQGSNDGSNWTTIGTSPDTGEGQTVTIDMNSNTTPYKYFKLNVRNGGWAYEDALQIRNLHLFGQMRSTIEGTEFDYDYKIEGGKPYIVKENIRKYYKYIAWEQPILTSNTSSSEMTVSATNEGQGGAWKAFNGSPTDDGWVTSNNTLSGTVYATLGKSIYLKSITLTGYRNSYGYTKTVTIYSDIAKTNLIGEAKTFFTSTGSASNISNTWTFNEPIKVTDLAFYCVGGSNWVALSEVSINADMVVDGTPGDYDFYKDVDVYKAIKSYTKGQYYGN